MPIFHHTPQRLDPLGGVTAQVFAWVACAGALATAVVIASIHDRNAHPAGLIAAFAALIASIVIVLTASAPRYAPFSRSSAGGLHLLGVVAVVLEAIARSGADVTPRTSWAPVSLAILIMVTSSFRPPGEIIFMSLLSAAAVGVVEAVVAARVGSHAPGVFFVVSASLPIVCVGVGAGAFSWLLVRRLLQWRAQTEFVRNADVQAMRARVHEEIQREGLALAESEIDPFLREVLAAGGTGEQASARARILADRLRGFLSRTLTESWSSVPGVRIEDPRGQLAQLDEAQRAAIEVVCLVLARSSPRVVLNPGEGFTTLTITWTRGLGRLRGDVIAMLRDVFPAARIARRAPRIETVVELRDPLK